MRSGTQVEALALEKGDGIAEKEVSLEGRWEEVVNSHV